MGQYIGSRYVPKFEGEYDPSQSYEVLTVVDNGMGTSYISKIPTPAGTPLSDREHWALYGSPSGSIIHIQDEIDDINAKLANCKVYNILDYENLKVGSDWATVINGILALTEDPVAIYIPTGTYNIETKIEVNRGRVHIFGDTVASTLKLVAAADAVIELSNNPRYLEIENLELDCNYNASYGLYSQEWAQNMRLSNVRIGKANTAGFAFPTFITTLENCWAFNCPTGFHIQMKDGTRSTSTTLQSCFVTDATVEGYKLELVYSNLINCAADRCEVAYNVYNCFGVNLIGCGSEDCKKIATCLSWWGGSILGFNGHNNGDDAYTSSDFLFDFDSIVNVSIGGYQGSVKGSPSMINIRNNRNGYENITILDNCIEKSECSAVSNYRFSKPIKFIRDELGNDRTIEVSSESELAAALNNLPENINHILTVKLTAGFELSRAIISNVHGSGMIIIDLNGNTVKTYTNTSKMFYAENSAVPVIIKNGTIENRFSNNYQILTQAINAKMMFDNVSFVNAVSACGSILDCARAAFAVIGANCTKTGSFGTGGVYQTVDADATSFVDNKPSF